MTNICTIFKSLFNVSKVIKLSRPTGYSYDYTQHITLFNYPTIPFILWLYRNSRAIYDDLSKGVLISREIFISFKLKSLVPDRKYLGGDRVTECVSMVRGQSFMKFAGLRKKVTGLFLKKRKSNDVSMYTTRA